MKFDMDNLPSMKPLAIKTKDKNFFGAIWVWIATTRKWQLTQDWTFSIEGTKYKVPQGFTFDGASVPKYFRSWLSPMGVLLIPGLVHDYGYKFAKLMLYNGVATEVNNQKYFDKLFRDIAIEVNGFKLINYVAYYALRLGGFIAWRGHRQRDSQL